MRVLVDALIYQKDPYGGIARMFREILPRMCDLEPELEIVLFSDGPLVGELPNHPQILVRHAPPIRRTIRVQGNIRKILFPFRRIASRSWNRLRGIWLRAERQSIWHSTFYTTPTSWKGSQVVTVYDMIHELFPEIYNDPLDQVTRDQKRKSIEQASLVICISEATCRDIERLYRFTLDKSAVIHIACSPVFHLLTLPENTPVDIPKPFLLYIGKRAAYKNFSNLLEAYREWEGRTETSLVLVGPSWTNEEKQTLRQYGLSSRAHLLNHVDDSTLCRLYNQAVALVFPSIYEGFGIPILEAQACGCPVVASRIPSSLEIGGDSPFFFDLDKPGDLLNAIHLASQVGYEPERIQQGLANAGKFSWDRTARQTLEVYRQVQIAD